MAYTFYPSEVIDIIDEAHNVKRFFFKVTEFERFDFYAGQFVMLDLPLNSKVQTRAYSIASAPDGTNVFELIIVLKEDGLGTPYLWQNVRIGSIIPVTKAIGKFMGPRPASFDTDLCFICTGTGIAPFRAIVQDILNHNIPHKNINLIFGCRYQKDITYRKEFEETQKQLPGFRYIPILSRQGDETWKGETGYVHRIYKELYADKTPCTFYLCGWKVMIMEARQNLLDMGYDKKQIKFELYD
ncbi:MAG: ferredoxin--NADP reductase [Bacteroidetes bacterium]|nr:ferredoxin--NADP reductase [Bacteroidota bacterium]